MVYSQSYTAITITQFQNIFITPERSLWTYEQCLSPVLPPFSYTHTTHTQAPLCRSFRINLSISARKLLMILTEIVLNLWYNLESIVVLTVLRFPIHDHGISFHLFRSSLTSFSDILQFSVIQALHFFC